MNHPSLVYRRALRTDAASLAVVGAGEAAGRLTAAELETAIETGTFAWVAELSGSIVGAVIVRLSSGQLPYSLSAPFNLGNAGFVELAFGPSEAVFHLIRQVFGSQPDLDYILLRLDANHTPDSQLFFPLAGVEPEADNDTLTWHYCEREMLIPSLYLRDARVEDSDDLIPVFEAQSEVLKESFGEFFLAEVIESQSTETRVLVGEGSDGSAAGLMALSGAVNMQLLQACFQLGAYDGLVHRSPVADAIQARTMAITAASRSDWFALMSVHARDVPRLFDAVSESVASAQPNGDAGRGGSGSNGNNNNNGATHGEVEAVPVAALSEALSRAGEAWGYVGTAGLRLGSAMMLDLNAGSGDATITRDALNASVEAFASRREECRRRNRLAKWYAPRNVAEAAEGARHGHSLSGDSQAAPLPDTARSGVGSVSIGGGLSSRTDAGAHGPSHSHAKPTGPVPVPAPTEAAHQAQAPLAPPGRRLVAEVLDRLVVLAVREADKLGAVAALAAAADATDDGKASDDRQGHGHGHGLGLGGAGGLFKAAKARRASLAGGAAEERRGSLGGGGSKVLKLSTASVAAALGHRLRGETLPVPGPGGTDRGSVTASQLEADEMAESGAGHELVLELLPHLKAVATSAVATSNVAPASVTSQPTERSAADSSAEAVAVSTPAQTAGVPAPAQSETDTAFSRAQYLMAIEEWERAGLRDAVQPRVWVTAADAHSYSLVVPASGAVQLAPSRLEQVTAAAVSSILHLPHIHVPSVLVEAADRHGALAAAAASAATAAEEEKRREAEEAARKGAAKQAAQAQAQAQAIAQAQAQSQAQPQSPEPAAAPTGGAARQPRVASAKGPRPAHAHAPKQQQSNAVTLAAAATAAAELAASAVDPAADPLQALHQRLARPDCANGYVLTGLPQAEVETVEQVRAKFGEVAATIVLHATDSDDIFAPNAAHGRYGPTAVVGIEEAADESEARDVLLRVLHHEGVMAEEIAFAQYDRAIQDAQTDAAERGNNGPNAFSITLFAIQHQHESRIVDFLTAAFAAFPDREYAIITQPHAAPDMPLLRSFVQVPAVAGSTVPQVLYLAHKDNLRIPAAIAVRKATSEDRLTVLNLSAVSSQHNSSVDMMEAFVAATAASHSKTVQPLAAFIAEMDGVALACVIIELHRKDGGSALLRALVQSFEVESLIAPGHYPNEAGIGIIAHILLTPLASSGPATSHILRECMRLCGDDVGRGATGVRVLFHKLHLGDELPAFVRETMIPVKPRSLFEDSNPMSQGSVGSKPASATAVLAQVTSFHGSVPSWAKEMQASSFSSSPPPTARANTASPHHAHSADAAAYGSGTSRSHGGPGTARLTAPSVDTPKSLSTDSAAALNPRLMPFALHIFTERLAAERRVAVNTRVVIVGASDAGHAVAASLIFASPHVVFPHIHIVSPGGLPALEDADYDPTHPSCDAWAAAPFASLLPGRSFTSFELSRLPLASYVTVVDEVVTSISRPNKRLGLGQADAFTDETAGAGGVSGGNEATMRTAGSMGYDLLVLTPGLVEPTWWRLRSEAPNDVPRGVYCLMPSMARAALEANLAAAAAAFTAHREGVGSNGEGEADGTAGLTARSVHSDGELGLGTATTRTGPGDVVVYGNGLEALTAIQACLSRGVPASRIVYVQRPMPPGSETSVDGQTTQLAAIATLEGAISPMVGSLLSRHLEQMGIRVIKDATIASVAETSREGDGSGVGAEDAEGLISSSESGEYQDDSELPLLSVEFAVHQYKTDSRVSNVNPRETGSSPETEHKENTGFDSSRRIALSACLLLCGDTPDVDPRLFNAVNDSGIVFDGRVVVDHMFRTTDPAVYAGGTAAKFSRRYRAPQPLLQEFDSREGGEQLAGAILQELLPSVDDEDIYLPGVTSRMSLSEAKDQSEKALADLLPQFTQAKTVRAVLPGGLHYSRTRLPTSFQNYDGAATFLQTGPEDTGSNGRYCRLELDRFERVVGLTALTPGAVRGAGNLARLVGRSAAYMNGLIRRWSAGTVPDLVDFFVAPGTSTATRTGTPFGAAAGWATMVYHDRFGGLVTELRKAIAGEVRSGKAPVDTQFAAILVAELGKTLQEAATNPSSATVMDRIQRNIGVTGSQLPLQLRRTLERLVTGFLRDNRELLPAFFVPIA